MYIITLIVSGILGGLVGYFLGAPGFIGLVIGMTWEAVIIFISKKNDD